MPNKTTHFAFMRHRALPLLLLILLLGAARILPNLDKLSLWADEGWTISASAEPTPGEIINNWVALDVHPPLFFIELWGWRQFTGDSIFEMRYFSFMLILMTIAVMYRVGHGMFGTVQAGTWSALFFALHDLVLVLTHEVRHYPQQQLFTALTLWMYWRLWQKPTSYRVGWFGVMGATLLWSHYWGGFILLATALHSLMTRWSHLRPYVIGHGLAALLFLPWLPFLYDQIRLERPGGLPHALENSWVVYKTLAFQLIGVPELFWLCLAGIGLVGWLSWTHQQSSTLSRFWSGIQITLHPASVLLGLCVILTSGLSIGFNEFYPTLSFRSLAVVIPPFVALAGYGFSLFRPRERGVLLLFILTQSLFTSSAQPVPRAPWPDLARNLAQHSTDQDVILFELDSDEYSVEYYLNQTAPHLNYLHSERDRLRHPRTYKTDLAERLVGYDGVWVAKFGWYYYDVRPDLAELGYVPVAPIQSWPAYTDGRPIEVSRYELPPTEDESPLLTLGERFSLGRANWQVHPEWVTVNLLWTPLVELDDFYTVSVFLLHESGVILTPGSQHDSYPLEGRAPTLGWQTGQWYFDSHVLSTKGLPASEYQIGLKLYRPINGDYNNLEILPPDTCADTACTYAVLGSLHLP